jgi:prophage DNA circulation protein
MTTWREKYQTGSFRRILFSTLASDIDGGRRVALHQYPRREVPYPEDMGREARRYRIRAIIGKDNYFEHRDRLVEVLEQPGPGTLVHPYLGTMEVQIERWTCRESTAEAATATFEIEFHEAGAAAQPEAGPDTAEAVDAAADDAEASLEDEAAGELEADAEQAVQEDTGSFLDDALDAIAEAPRQMATLAGEVNSFMGRVQGLKAKLLSLVLAPANLAGGLLGAVGSVRGIASSSVGALGVYKGLFSYGGAFVDPPGSGRIAAAQRKNRQALKRLVRTGAAINAARAVAAAQPYRYIGPASPIYASVAGPAAPTSASAAAARRPASAGALAAPPAAVQVNGRAVVLAVPEYAGFAVPEPPGFATWQEAAAARDIVAAALDEAALTAGDALYPALRALSAAVAAHVNAQRPALACGARYVAGSALPSLLLAHRIYGDAARADELEIRNRVRHPGFVPGGRPLEIIQ